jgi:hypothetical protein
MAIQFLYKKLRDWTFQNVTETLWVGHLEKVTLALWTAKRLSMA